MRPPGVKPEAWRDMPPMMTKNQREAIGQLLSQLSFSSFFFFFWLHRVQAVSLLRFVFNVLFVPFLLCHDAVCCVVHIHESRQTCFCCSLQS